MNERDYVERARIKRYDKIPERERLFQELSNSIRRIMDMTPEEWERMREIDRANQFALVQFKGRIAEAEADAQAEEEARGTRYAAA